jgi:hypothetical protein
MEAAVAEKVAVLVEEAVAREAAVASKVAVLSEEAVTREAGSGNVVGNHDGGNIFGGKGLHLPAGLFIGTVKMLWYLHRYRQFLSGNL